MVEALPGPLSAGLVYQVSSSQPQQGENEHQAIVVHDGRGDALVDGEQRALAGQAAPVPTELQTVGKALCKLHNGENLLFPIQRVDDADGLHFEVVYDDETLYISSQSTPIQCVDSAYGFHGGVVYDDETFSIPSQRRPCPLPVFCAGCEGRDYKNVATSYQIVSMWIHQKKTGGKGRTLNVAFTNSN